MTFSLRPILILGGLLALAASAWAILYLNPPEQKPYDDAAAGIGMKRFLLADSERGFPDASFQDARGARVSLDRFEGRVILVNLWATWCPPCKEEMPTLARLQRLQGGDEFQVVTVAIEDVDAAALQEALVELGAENLPAYKDPSRRLTNTLGAIGLPTSVLLDRQGREIGRLAGPAKWDSPPALQLIQDARAGVFQAKQASDS